MSESEDGIAIRPRESSVKGGGLVFVIFPDTPPEAEIFVVFRGSMERHEVPIARDHDSPMVLQAVIPAHKLPEVVDLSVCCLDDNGEQKSLSSTKFSYTEEEKQYLPVAELLVQGLVETESLLQYSLLPPLTTAEALQEFDASLREAFEGVELPRGWTLVGCSEDTARSEEDCAPRETLLHFAARHSLNSLAQHLLHLPGAEIAAKLPNEKGELPLDLARKNRNDGLTQLLTLFMSSSNGLLSSELTGQREAGAGKETPRRRKKRGLEHFKKINEEWITKVKRHRSSSVSVGQIEHLLNAKNGPTSPLGSQPSSSTADSHPATTPAPAPPVLQRRKTVAVMQCTTRHWDVVPLANHILDPSPVPFDLYVINVTDPGLAQMERQRKVSWSKVVGTCDSRSVGTGLNELDRIVAEDTLQEKVATVQAELDHHHLVRPRSRSGEDSIAPRNSHLSLDQSQLDVLYRLSASCPSLVEDSDPATPSVDLSVSITPGPESPFSEDGHSLELTESSSPVTDSLLPPHTLTSSQGGMYSRTNTSSSTGSQPPRSVSAPNPPIITTTEFTLGAEFSLMAEVSPGMEVSFMADNVEILEQEIDTGVHVNGNTCNSKDTAAAVSNVPGDLSPSTTCQDGVENGLGVEDSLPEIPLVVPTPDRQVLTEAGSTESREASGDGNKTQPKTGQLNEKGDTGIQQSSELPEGPSDEGETSVNPEDVGPLKRTSHSEKRVALTPSAGFDKRGHRRSASTSKLEMMSPTKNLVLEHEEQDNSEEDKMAVFSTRSSVWQPTLGSTDSVDEGSSLSLDQALASGAGSLRDDDRSRASSMLSSMQEDNSESSDEDASFHSAQGSLSHLALTPLHSLATSSPHGELARQEDENAKFKLKSSSSSSTSSSNSKEENTDGIVLRRTRRSLKASPVMNRYSDVQLTRIDDVMDNSSEGELDRSNSNPALSQSYDGQSLSQHSSATPTNSSVGGPPEESSSAPVNKKASVDSTFTPSEGYLTPSEVDVKFDSDENSSVSRSLESSLDHAVPSQSQLKRKDAIKSPSGSPRTHRRFPKSPVFSRKRRTGSAESSKENSPTLRSKTGRKTGGLSRDEVTPTIQALKSLMESVADEDAPIGAEHDETQARGERTVRTGSLNAPSKASLERTGSAVSDSVMFVTSKRDRNTGSGPQPLLETQSEDSLTHGSGSLSPHSLAKKQHLGESPKQHPPSPLFFSRSKSPTLTVSTADDGQTSPTSSTLIHAGKDSHLDGSSRSFSADTPVGKVASDSNIHGLLSTSEASGEHHAPKLSKADRALSVDALYTRLETVEPQLKETISEEPEEEMEHSLDRLAARDERLTTSTQEVAYVGEHAETYSVSAESHVSSTFEYQAEQAPRTSWKDLLWRGEFIRSSKHNKKGKRATEAVRSKPVKVRPPVNETTFEEPRRQAMEGTPPPQGEAPHVTPESDIRRSETMQIRSSGKVRKMLGLNEEQESDSSIPPSPSKGATLQPNSGEPELRRPRSHTTPAVGFVPAESVPGSDTEGEEDSQVEEQLARTLSLSYPELAVEEDLAWDKTVNRKLYKKLNRVEKERQAIIHELIQTERHHLRALNVLRLIFRDNISELVSGEVLQRMFPELDNLINISQVFLAKLESRKASGQPIVEDISDILLEEYSGENHERMKLAFGHFCSYHLESVEHYKDHLRKKSFNQLMKKLHLHKACNRLTLPDYFTQVSQRLAKLVTLLQRLVKKTDSMKLDHASVLRESLEKFQVLVTSVDKMVEDHKNRVEAMDIQSRLEISVPRSAKNCNRKDIKSLSLTAQDRKLRKRGDAVWKGAGQGRQVAVHIVLVTDFVVLLTERDQKYQLAALQDLKPPVIRLYDLHVRLNAAVKSLVQLLLLEKGEHPEMFRLEFLTKREAKEWEAALNTAIEECKKRELKCECFGCEKILSGDEERKSEEKELEDSDREGEQGPANQPGPDTSPSILRRFRATESLEFATRLLSTAPSLTTTDASTANRHTGAASAAVVSSKVSRSNSKNTTATFSTQRPKTTYFDPEAETGGSTLASSSSKPSKAKPPKKPKLERSKTFKREEREREGGGGDAKSARARLVEQQYIRCITDLKESLEETLNDNQEKDRTIAELREEIKALRESLSSPEGWERRGELAVVPRNGRRTSSFRGSPQQRPHSVYFERSMEEETDTELADSEAALPTDGDTGTGT